MNWKKGQWVRFNTFVRSQDGDWQETHCFYKIKGIQRAKETFSVEFPAGYRFSLNDGSVIYNKEKAPWIGNIVPLSPKEETWIAKHVAESPNCFFINKKS